MKPTDVAIINANIFIAAGFISEKKQLVLILFALAWFLVAMFV